jgi:hypothetical protein
VPQINPGSYFIDILPSRAEDLIKVSYRSLSFYTKLCHPGPEGFFLGWINTKCLHKSHLSLPRVFTYISRSCSEKRTNITLSRHPGLASIKRFVVSTAIMAALSTGKRYTPVEIDGNAMDLNELFFARIRELL